MKIGLGTAVLIAGLLVTAPVQAEAPRERAAKLMKKLAKEKKPAARAEAARELGDMKAWDAVEALGTALADPAAEVRAAAAYALVKLEDKAKDAAPALKTALADDDRLVRYNAVVALHNTQAATPAELAPPLASLLADEDDEDDRKNLALMLVNQDFDDKTVRKVVIDQIERGTPEVRRAILDQMWSQDTLKTRAPWKAEVAKSLTALMTGDKDPKVRRQAIVLLWKGDALSSGPVGQALLKAIDDPDEEVSHQAAATLNGMEKSPLAATAVTHLTSRLKSTDPEVRASAARTLGGLIGYREKFRGALMATLANDKEPEVRVAAVVGLDDISDDTVVPALLKALKTDTDPDVRRAVCKAWAETGTWMQLERTKTLEAARAALEEARSDARLKRDADAALAALKR
jgi:HEAT repeat protein